MLALDLVSSNTVPLRIYLSGDNSFLRLVIQPRSNILKHKGWEKKCCLAEVKPFWGKSPNLSFQEKRWKSVSPITPARTRKLILCILEGLEIGAIRKQKMHHTGLPRSPCEEALQGRGPGQEVWGIEKDPRWNMEDHNWEWSTSVRLHTC